MNCAFNSFLKKNYKQTFYRFSQRHYDLNIFKLSTVSSSFNRFSKNYIYKYSHENKLIQSPKNNWHWNTISNKYAIAGLHCFLNNSNFIKTFCSESNQSLKDRIKKESILTVPNLLTASRIILTPFLGVMVLQNNFNFVCWAFIFAGFTDLLDGWIARRFPSQKSAFGSFLDPLGDKLLINTLFITLSMVDLLPVALTLIVVLRDFFLILAAFYVRYISLTSPITFSSFFDVTNPTAYLKPMFISKLNTVIQLSLVAVTIAAPVFHYVDHPFLHISWYVCAGTTVASGIGYLFAKNTFRILQKK